MADGSVTIEVELTKEQLEKSLNSIKTDLNNLEKSSSGVADKISKHLLNIGSAAENAGKKLTLGLTTPLATLATAGISYNAELEKYQTALTTLTGSEKEAAEIMEQIQKDAAKTPFDVAGLTQANQLLISTGLSAEDSRDTILALGDAVSATGGGNDELSRMAVNLQQIKNTGKATALDIKQFAYAGIDIYGLLADYTGKTKEEVSDMAITWDDLNGALIKASKKGGKYFEAMEKQSETLNGATSNLKDSFSRFTSSLTRGLVPTVKKVLDKVTDWLDKFNALDESTQENITKIGLFIAAVGPALTIFGKISTAVGKGKDAIKLFVDALGVARGDITSTKDSVNKLAGVFSAITSPIGIACTAIVGIIAGIGIAVKKENEKVESAFSNMGNAAADFYNELQTAEGYLDDFNNTIFASSEEQQELAAQMDEIQADITKICKTASDERRDYTQQEITQLNEYFEKLRELKDREIEIYQARIETIAQLAESENAVFDGSLEEYKVRGTEWIATAQDQADELISIAESRRIEEIAALNAMYSEKERLTNEDYINGVANAEKTYQEAVAAANKQVGDVSAIYAEGYAERANQDGDFYEHLKHYIGEQENLQNAHNETIRKIKDNELWYVTNNAQAIQSENETFAFHQKETWKEMYKNMSESEAKQLGVWLAWLANTEMFGGEIKEEHQKIAAAILDSYDEMPDDVKKTASQAMEGMLKGMEETKPTLYAKASGIANGILSRLKKAFDIHSPSKKTRKIFRYAMEGAELGLEDEESNLYKQVDNISDRILKGFNISSLYQKMQDKVNLETQKLANNLTTSSILNVQRNSNIQARLESIDDNKEIQVKSTLNLDGKVVASTVNRVNAKQKLQYGIA